MKNDLPMNPVAAGVRKLWTKSEIRIEKERLTKTPIVRNAIYPCAGDAQIKHFMLTVSFKLDE